MNSEPEETLEQVREERDTYRRALLHIMREKYEVVPFTEQEIEDLKKNGVSMDEVLREVKKVMGMDDD